jgi:hypothetical protein
MLLLIYKTHKNKKRYMSEQSHHEPVEAHRATSHKVSSDRYLDRGFPGASAEQSDSVPHGPETEQQARAKQEIHDTAEKAFNDAALSHEISHQTLRQGGQEAGIDIIHLTDGVDVEHMTSSDGTKATIIELPDENDSTDQDKSTGRSHEIVIVEYPHERTLPSDGSAIEIIVDGVEADATGVEAVKGTVEQIARELAEENTGQDQPESETSSEEESEGEDASEKPDAVQDDTPEQPDDENKEKQKELNKKGVAALMTYVRSPVARATFMATLSEAGIDQKALMAGEVDLSPQAPDAFRRLRGYAGPESAIWHENPNVPSGIGAAAKEAQGVLRQTILAMVGRNIAPR